MMGLFRRILGLDKTPATNTGAGRLTANVIFVCKNSGGAPREVDEQIEKARSVVRSFADSFQDRFTGEPEIEAGPGRPLVITFHVCCSGMDDLQAMKRCGDQLVMKHGLSDWG